MLSICPVHSWSMTYTSTVSARCRQFSGLLFGAKHSQMVARGGVGANFYRWGQLEYLEHWQCFESMGCDEYVLRVLSVSRGSVLRILPVLQVGASTQTVHWNKWQTWCRLRAIEGKSPWLAEGDGVDAAVKELTKFMALRCFAFKNQSQTIRGYLSAIKYFHRMFGGWERPTSHCMVVAEGKGIDRAHGKSEIRPKVGKSLT